MCVRQGGVLSPVIFAIYIDNLVNRIFVPMGILLYEDDVILLSPSVMDLQKMLNICESNLNWLDMWLNQDKSVCESAYDSIVIVIKLYVVLVMPQN